MEAAETQARRLGVGVVVDQRLESPIESVYLRRGRAARIVVAAWLPPARREAVVRRQLATHCRLVGDLVSVQPPLDVEVTLSAVASASRALPSTVEQKWSTIQGVRPRIAALVAASVA